MAMSNSKRVRDQLRKQAGWVHVEKDKWKPGGLYCVKCGRWSEPENANNAQCPFCGGNLLERP